MDDVQYTLQPMSSNILMDLEKAIDGEYNAIFFYERLAQLAPNEEIRTRILEIRKDEMRHFQGFSYIFTCLTGQNPSPK